MRTLWPVGALLLAGAAVLVGWSAGAALFGAVVGFGAILGFGYRYGRVPASPLSDAELEEARAKGVDPYARAEFFSAFRARSRTVERALKDTSRRARPFLEPWPSVDPRHPRLAEAMDALRRGD